MRGHSRGSFGTPLREPGRAFISRRELFNLTAHTQIVHIPYKSVPLALTDLFANRIQLIFDNTSSIGPHVRSGKVRALGVTSSKRSAGLPDIPTLAESGVTNYDLVVWSGLVVPAATAPATIDRLNSAVNQVLQTPEVRDKLMQLGLEMVGGSAQSFAQLIANESRKWIDVARKANIPAGMTGSARSLRQRMLHTHER